MKSRLTNGFVSSIFFPDPPVVTIIDGSHLIPNENDDVKITCTVDSNPESQLSWQYQIGNKTHKLSVTGMFLLLPSVRRDSTGVYMCLARNTIGNGSAETTVTVQCKYLFI